MDNFWLQVPIFLMSVLYIVLIGHLVLYEPRDREKVLFRRLEFWKLDGKMNELYVWIGACFIIAIVGDDLMQDSTVKYLHLKDIAIGLQAILGHTWLVVLATALLKKLRNTNE